MFGPLRVAERVVVGAILGWLYDCFMELNEHERLIWRGHPSMRSSVAYFIRWGFLVVVPISIAGILRLNDQGTGLAYWKWVVITLLLLVVVIAIDTVRRALTDYVVTDHRIRIRRGVLSRKEQSAAIERVQNINTTQSLLDRLLGIGEIDFDTAGTESTQASLEFSGVARPHELVRKFERHVATLREP
jgi:uncharacterized membrane protein YdbT with pleckstrin-like domain